MLHIDGQTTKRDTFRIVPGYAGPQKLPESFTHHGRSTFFQSLFLDIPIDCVTEPINVFSDRRDDLLGTPVVQRCDERACLMLRHSIPVHSDTIPMAPRSIRSPWQALFNKEPRYALPPYNELSL